MCKQKCRTVKEGKISDFLFFVFQWIPYSWPKWHLLYPLRTPSQHLHRRQVWQLIVSRFKVATSKLRQIEGAVLSVCAQVIFFSFFLIFEDVYLFLAFLSYLVELPLTNVFAETNDKIFGIWYSNLSSQPLLHQLVPHQMMGKHPSLLAAW